MADPDSAKFVHLARRALDALPAHFREHLDGVRIVIEEFADRETLAAVALDDPWDLTGLYEGRPLDEQSAWDWGEMPPVITLYRAPLLRELHEEGLELDALVTHVVVHEVGHHFGLSDEEMAAIENAA